MIPNKDTNAQLRQVAVQYLDHFKVFSQELGIRGVLQGPPPDLDVFSYDFDARHISEERGHKVKLD